MNTISDIRLFRSMIGNIDGNPHPNTFANRGLNVVIHRIVMKLREQGFSLGDFDHLYVNFTTCLEKGEMLPTARSVDPYHKWYRYYDIGIDRDTYQMLNTDAAGHIILVLLLNLLIRYFSAENACSISDCIAEAVNSAEHMLALYKTKQTGSMQAKIFLQYLNDGRYLPHLFVYNEAGTEILHRKLAGSTDLMSIGEIQMRKRKITIKPRKNSFTKKLTAVVFELPD